MVSMEPLKFFDCNCSFGIRRVVNPGSFYKVQDLVEKMKWYGINKALVYHSMAREYCPTVGNEMLMQEIKEYDDILYPVWVVMHHHSGEFPEPDVLAKKMKDNNVKAVCMFPSDKDQNYSISEWNCGELFSMIEKFSIPLFMSFDQLTWDRLYELCSNHPKLKIILTGVNYRADRNLCALFKLFPNIYVETSGYKVHNGIEEICEKFGATRLIFGSGLPLFSGGAAVSMINYARISKKERQMIAYENIESLLGGVQL